VTTAHTTAAPEALVAWSVEVGDPGELLSWLPAGSIVGQPESLPMTMPTRAAISSPLAVPQQRRGRDLASR